jgi:hypothetical protein
VKIANLLSIPQLEKSGCKIQYNTGGKWLILTPNNRVVTFERDVGVCGGMPTSGASSNNSEFLLDTLSKPAAIVSFSCSSFICFISLSSSNNILEWVFGKHAAGSFLAVIQNGTIKSKKRRCNSIVMNPALCLKSPL